MKRLNLYYEQVKDFNTKWKKIVDESANLLQKAESQEKQANKILIPDESQWKIWTPLQLVLYELGHGQSKIFQFSLWV